MSRRPPQLGHSGLPLGLFLLLRSEPPRPQTGRAGSGAGLLLRSGGRRSPALFLLDELPSDVCWGLGLEQGAIKRETDIKRGKWTEAKRKAAKFFFLFHSVREIPQTEGSVTSPRHGPAATWLGRWQGPQGGQGPQGKRSCPEPGSTSGIASALVFGGKGRSVAAGLCVAVEDPHGHIPGVPAEGRKQGGDGDSSYFTATRSAGANTTRCCSNLFRQLPGARGRCKPGSAALSPAKRGPSRELLSGRGERRGRSCALAPATTRCSPSHAD